MTEPTYRAQMKSLREKLRYAQMQVRLELYSLVRAKLMVKGVALQMRILQQQEKEKRNGNKSN